MNHAVRALGRLKTGQMNKTEEAYAAFLDGLLAQEKIVWWAFEPAKIRLADNTFYSPDFGVLRPDGRLEFHEVKGFWQDDARVKIKVAAAKFPALFIAVKAVARKHGGGWSIEEF